ncbi:hypothetical protein [Rhodococcus globerulus]|uniref:hypothetical protein n=1 Tax=Rhodococcus globerulus TaxID=33008 RepID=UPI0030169E9F
MIAWRLFLQVLQWTSRRGIYGCALREDIDTSIPDAWSPGAFASLADLDGSGIHSR